MSRGYWLSDDVIIELHVNGPPTLVVPESRLRLRIGLRELLLLCEVVCFNANGKPAILQDLRTDPELLQLTSQLSDLHILVNEDQRKVQNDGKSKNMLSLLEWATIRLSQAGGSFNSNSTGDKKVSPRSLPNRNIVRSYPLPEPGIPADVSLWDTLESRRSGRTGPTRSITLSTLSALLNYSLRIQNVAEDTYGEISFKPVASGGARQPIDAFIVALRVAELEEGVYRYNPLAHHISRLMNTDSNTSTNLAKAALAALGDSSDTLPAVTLFFIAIPDRTACKYRDNALTLIMRDLGCIIQQLYLIAVGLGLIGCAVGGGDPLIIEQALDLNADQEVFVGGFVIW